MPNHDEQMNRRREKREALRKRQQAQARRLRLTAFAAVLVLAACGGLIWYLTKGTQEPEVQTQAAVEQTTAPTETEAPDPRIQKDPLTTIHIRAAGDLNITDSVISSGVSVGGYDFGTVFKDVSALLSDADLTVMNFEGNTYGEPYGTASSSAPNKILEDLRGCGVDLLQMANSCSINNGLNGLSATLQSIRAAGIEPVGAYANQTELNTGKGYTIAEAQGIKVAFVAFTKGMGGRGLPAGSEGLVNVLYEDYDSEYQKINTKGIETILKNVQAEEPDLVVALVHWGSEYNEDISSSQESIISLMQKRGVDVYRGQRWFGHAGFCGIVKSADKNIIGYPFPHGSQRLKQIGGHKIIGANKDIGKRFHGVDHGLHFLQMVVLDDESRVHTLTGHGHSKIESGISFVERLAVVIIPYESDAV